MRVFASFLCILALLLPNFGEAFTFSEKEIEQIRVLGPWPQSFTKDGSNRFSGKEVAVAFGKMLFETSDLSLNRDQSCSFCHQAEKNFTDGLAKGEGIEEVDRNTISLFDVRLRHWYGWSGQSDTLWGASIRPLLDPREMGMTPELVKERVVTNEAFLLAYQTMVGKAASVEDPAAVLVNIGKALAAFQEGLNSKSTAFDRFRSALVEDAQSAVDAYPKNAKRGLRLYLGKANCIRCHDGPNFGLDEFHNIGLPPTDAPLDYGRENGLVVLAANPWVRSGSHSDLSLAGPDRISRHETTRAFRVPSLRGLTKTAPYMHDGRFETLLEAVSHYSDFDEEDLPKTGEKILEPLGLTHRQLDQLVAFLMTLSN
ncbi:c-type cytochrome [Alphaproteobacteria bacterium]|jgi:cytochrome c peroxidase|nr:c-type cytochrome [Alphaproteobacteria bacterium]